MTSQIVAAAAIGVIVAAFGAGWYCGGLRAKSQLEALQSSQFQALAHAYVAQQNAAAALQSHMQGVIDAYDADKDLPDPASVGLATRVLYRSGPGCDDVPKAAALAGGTPAPGPQPGGDQRAGELLQAVFDAAEADAKQLDAVIQLAPK
jgi:hypothetical protein